VISIQYLFESILKEITVTKLKHTGQLVKEIPFDVKLIPKVWDESFKNRKDIYSIEGPFDQNNPKKDPKTYKFYKGPVIEGQGRTALKYIHTIDSGTGKRQADLYWKLLDQGYKIDYVIEKYKGNMWVAYYVLRKI
jgi:hypothetical protein